MIVFFRRLPLTLKLLLIGIIPILFLIYFSVLIFKEKSQTVELINDNIERVDQSANISELINELGRERGYSYLYSIKKTDHDKIVAHRLNTDSIISILKKSSDLGLYRFDEYTFLNRLNETRAAIDSSSLNPDAIVQFYTDAIVRLNTLNSTIPSNTFLKPVYQDLIAQRILAEMITYLEIIRTNIFNALFIRKYMTETLLGTYGVYKVYKSYETEFLVKASPASITLYNNEKKLTDYGVTMTYINKLFETFRFDSTYNEEQWRAVSTNGLNVLRKQQRDLWKSVDMRMKEISTTEVRTKNLTLLFLLIAILFVIAFIAYFINDITRLLRELRLAARKISRGETDLQLKNMPSGVIGNLAKSINQIDKNNLRLTEAANEIGKGNFDVEVNTRSDKDLLGISIKKMQHDLQEFASQKDKIQKETQELVYKRDEFFSIASHELKTPVTSLKAYTQLLLMDATGSGDLQREKMLQRMNAQMNKLTVLINDLLDISRLQNGKLVYNLHTFEMKQLVTEIIDEIEPTSEDIKFVFNPDTNALVNADHDRIGQVLNNLLINAIKYAPDTKKIIITLVRKDNYIVCSVHDFGSGIIPDEYEKIFERFYRISGHNKNTYPGLGLGLYISKEIIEKHGGEIWVESEKEKGATFFFSLPAEKFIK